MSKQLKKVEEQGEQLARRNAKCEAISDTQQDSRVKDSNSKKRQKEVQEEIHEDEDSEGQRTSSWSKKDDNDDINFIYVSPQLK